MATTLAQQKAVAIAPKFTAFASAVGSAVTCFLILRRGSGSSSSGSKKRTYHRLVLGMSMCDFSASVAWFFTTWPIPQGTPGVYAAVGTQQTCSAQAFFAQFSLSTVMYNATLCVYYVLVIVKGWKDEDIVKIEPFLHGHAIAWGLGTGLASLALTLFNQVGWDCWISAAPLGCQESWNSPDGTTTCVRGDNGSLYQWAFYYAPLWFVIVLVSGLMYWVYHTVKAQEKAMDKYKVSAVGTSSGNDNGNEDDEIGGSSRKPGQLRRQPSVAQLSNYKRIQKQAFFYVGAFFVTWFFPTIFQLVIVISGKFPFSLLFLTALFVPIQGLLNLIVFIRPTFMRYRRAHPDEFFLSAWFRMLWQELKKDGSSAGRHSSTAYPGPSSRRSSGDSNPTEQQQQQQRRGERGVFSKTFRISYLKRKASDVSSRSRRSSAEPAATNNDDWQEEEEVKEERQKSENNGGEDFVENGPETTTAGTDGKV